MDTTHSDLAGSIKAARARKRWTQQDLADASGVSVSLIQKLEAGRKPHRNNLERISAALELTESPNAQTGPWSSDTLLILNTVGLFLEGCTPEERQSWAEKLTQQFMDSLG